MPLFPLADLRAKAYGRLDQNTVLYTLLEVDYVINEAIRSVCLFTGFYRATKSIPGFSVAGKLVYAPPDGLLTPSVVSFEGRQLQKISLKKLARSRRTWATDTTASRGPAEYWAPIGNGLFVITPKDAKGGRDISVTGIATPPKLVNPDDVMPLENEYVDIITEYCAHRLPLKIGGKLFADGSLALNDFYAAMKARKRYEGMKFPRYRLLESGEGGGMSTTVRELYDQFCFVCLEDLGLSLNVVTDAQFLNALAAVLLDFSERAPLDKTVFTQQLKADQPVYTVPEDLMKAELCFVGGKLIEKVTEGELTRGHLEWNRQSGLPRQWHEDNLGVKQVELFPKPNYNGTDIPGDGPMIGNYGDFFPSDRNLTIVGPGAPSKLFWTLDDTLDGIPDLFSHYLVYGVLEKVFNSESEMRDVQRANYCHTRFEESIALASAICHQELLEDDDDE